MRIGFIATRLQGTDGVTLEVEKWAKVLTNLGHESIIVLVNWEAMRKMAL